MLFKSYFLEKSAQKALKPLLLDLTGSSFFYIHVTKEIKYLVLSLVT